MNNVRPTGRPRLSARDIGAGLALGHAVAHQHPHDAGNLEIVIAAAYWAGATAELDDDTDEFSPDGRSDD
jgi:hypothetical protein